MEPLALCVGDYDSDRWSPEKQHELFNKIKSKNVKVYEKLLKQAKSMNGHSLDMISIATKMTWQEVIDTDDGYIMRSILCTKELAALYLDDKGFIDWVMKTPESGKKFIKEWEEYLN